MLPLVMGEGDYSFALPCFEDSVGSVLQNLEDSVGQNCSHAC